MKTIIYIVVSWNIITCAMFGLDKYKAVKGNWRISEKTLLLSAFLMGGIGGLFGMHLFKHKTKHIKFKLLMPLAVILNMGIAYLAWSKMLK